MIRKALVSWHVRRADRMFERMASAESTLGMLGIPAAVVRALLGEVHLRRAESLARGMVRRVTGSEAACPP